MRMNDTVSLLAPTTERMALLKQMHKIQVTAKAVSLDVIYINNIKKVILTTTL